MPHNVLMATIEFCFGEDGSLTLNGERLDVDHFVHAERDHPETWGNLILAAVAERKLENLGEPRGR